MRRQRPRRFEIVDAKSAKFWEVDQQGPTLVIRYGRLGDEGREQSKTFDSGARAEKACADLVREKLAKGYREVGAAIADVTAGTRARGGANAGANHRRASQERPLVAWTDRTRMLLHPRRSTSLDARLPLPEIDAEDAWKVMQRAYGPIAIKVKRGLRSATREDRSIITKADATMRSKTPPRETTPAIESVRAHFFNIHGQNVNTPDNVRRLHESIVHFWIAGFGVEFAVEAMIATWCTSAWDTGTSLSIARTKSDPSGGGQIINGDPAPWQVLRRAVAFTDDATYAKAREAAQRFHDKGYILFRCALAFVFPDEEKWSRKALADCTTDPKTPSTGHISYCARPLVSCFRDRATIERFLRVGVAPEYFYDLIDVLGGAASGAVLRRLLQQTLKKQKPPVAFLRALVGALTIIESKEVAKSLAKLRDHKSVGALAKAYFDRCPDLA